MKTIREVADLAGITIRTLRHYDEIGLLTPRDRSLTSGVRLYGREELLRLRDILIWRQFGFPLADIASLIDEPRHDHAEALRRQLDLAGEQLDKFRAITRGLELAIAAIDDGRSLREDEVFAGFASSLADEDASSCGPVEPRAGRRRIANFARLGGSSRYSAPTLDASLTRRRIVGTDPIRVAESLLALGVLPIGAGTYEDRFTDEPGTWPWPPYVEQVVRDRIRDVGHYGSDAGRIESTQPDLILDLTSWDGGGDSLAAAVSGGRFGYDAFSSIAPTMLLEYRPDGTPAFLRHLANVARAVGREPRAAALVNVWQARTAVLRPHLDGAEVAVVGSWGDGDYFKKGAGPFFAPTSEFGAQVFTSVGLRFTQVPDGDPWSNGWGISFERDGLAHLTASMMFFHSRHMTEERVADLFASRPLADLPAVKQRRVFALGWDFVNSGWFSAHWQLHSIAKVFGVTRLRAWDGRRTVYAAANVARGTLTVLPPSSGKMTLSNPLIGRLTFEAPAAECTTVTLSREIASSLCEIPESYRIAGESFGPVPLVHDRESALERIASGHEAASR